MTIDPNETIEIMLWPVKRSSSERLNFWPLAVLLGAHSTDSLLFFLLNYN